MTIPIGGEIPEDCDKVDLIPFGVLKDDLGLRQDRAVALDTTPPDPNREQLIRNVFNDRGLEICNPGFASSLHPLEVWVKKFTGTPPTQPPLPPTECIPLAYVFKVRASSETGGPLGLFQCHRLDLTREHIVPWGGHGACANISGSFDVIIGTITYDIGVFFVDGGIGAPDNPCPANVQLHACDGASLTLSRDTIPAISPLSVRCLYPGDIETYMDIDAYPHEPYAWLPYGLLPTYCVGPYLACIVGIMGLQVGGMGYIFS